MLAQFRQFLSKRYIFVVENLCFKKYVNSQSILILKNIGGYFPFTNKLDSMILVTFIPNAPFFHS